jgi:hypothetical protein
MGTEKIAAFYDDPVKTACDAWAFAKAYHLRTLTLSNSPVWRAQRWARFLVRLALGTVIAARKRLGIATPLPQPLPPAAVTPRPLHADAAGR